MKITPLLAIILFSTLLSGCLTTGSSYTQLKPQLEQWERDREYGRTLNALDQVAPTDPDYIHAARIRKQVEKQAADYEQQVRKETYQKQAKGDWAGALDQYDEALKRHPKSVVIKDGLAKLHQQQQKNIDQLERQRLIKHGEWLLDVLPLYQQGANVDPRNGEAQSRLRRINGEAEEISHALALLGSKALADNDLEGADATLPLSFELNRDPVIEESLKTLRSKQAAANKKYQETRRKSLQKAKREEQQRQRTVEGMLKLYNKAYAKGDFINARKYLQQIEKTDRHYSELPAMQRALQEAIDTRVSQQFDAGVSAYSRGQFELAAREWRELLKLEGSHQQAKENLDRAEKVLQKIERLKSKQQVN